MKVKELIKELQQVEDKELEVYIYYSGNNNLDKDGSLAYVDMVDDTLGDKVDINCVD